MWLRWRRPRLLDVQVALIFTALAVGAVVATTAIAAVTVVAQTNEVLNRQQANDTQAAALGAAAAYRAAPTHGGWREALAPLIAGADRTGEALKVLDRAGRVVRSTPGFGRFPPPSKTAPVVVGDRLVGSVVLNFGASGIGKIIGHFQVERWRTRLIAAGIGIVLALLLALVVTPMLVGPVDELMAAALARTRGQLHVRVGPVRGLRDMRELVATYDRMADAVDRQDEVRRNLVAYMAHELRTPIAVMQASTEAMMENVVEVTSDQIRSLHNEAVKLNELVDGLQRMSVTGATFAGLELRSEDLADIASTAADGLRSVYLNRRVSLVRHLESARVRCDAGRMREVITNLLTNAAKFTPASGQVNLETRPSKDTATLQVSDNGPGIPPEDLPLVAKRFYRSSSAAGTTGSGLGLAVADELVRAHGGTMTITSQLDQGTTVTIELPIEDADRAASVP